MSDSLLTHWNPPDFDCVEDRGVEAEHRLPDTVCFSQMSLNRILRTHPGELIEFYQDGKRLGVADQHSSLRNIGSVLRLEGITIIVRDVLKYHPDLQAAVQGMYDEIEIRTTDFRAHRRHADLVFMSRDAFHKSQESEYVSIWWQVWGRQTIEMHGIDADGNRSREGIHAEVPGGALKTCPGNVRSRVVGQDSINVALCTFHTNRRLQWQHRKFHAMQRMHSALSGFRSIRDTSLSHLYRMLRATIMHRRDRPAWTATT